MKRLPLLLLLLAGACIFSTPQDPRDDDNADAGLHDGGSVEDGGQLADAGNDDAGTDGGEPIVYARRWGNPVWLTALNSTSDDGFPSITNDLLRLCFVSTRDNTNTEDDIFCATRSSTSVPFENPVRQTNVNSAARDRHAVLWGKELYFSTLRDSAKSYEIYRSEWNALAGTFGPASPVAELNSESTDVPTHLSSDGLMLFLESNRPGSFGQTDLWISTRSTLTSPWSTPTNIITLNTPAFNEWALAPASDLSFVLFSTDQFGLSGISRLRIAEANPAGGWLPSSQADIRVPADITVRTLHMMSDGSLLATASKEGKDLDLLLLQPLPPDPPSKYHWGTPAPLTELNTSYIEAHPTMTTDRLKLCFTSDRQGSLGSTDIWCATRASATDPFGTPKNQTAINFGGYDAHPVLSADGTELFFYSERTGSGDLYRAVWVPADDGFKFPEAVTALNTSAKETSPALTSNDRVLLFDSDRAGGAGAFDLYMAVRPDRTSPFSAPTPLSALNSTFLDGEPGPDLDGYKVVFSSQRPISGENGAQPRRLWASEFFGNDNWSPPELLQFDGFVNTSVSGAALLSDGSLIFHTEASGNGNLYIAPPK